MKQDRLDDFNHSRRQRIADSGFLRGFMKLREWERITAALKRCYCVGYNPENGYPKP